VAIATLVWSAVLTFALLTLARTDHSTELSRLTVEKGSA
jgi:hypothetical protein